MQARSVIGTKSLGVMVMTRVWKSLIAWSLVLGVLFVAIHDSKAQNAPATESKWKKSIAAFEEQDQQTPYPKGQIVFVGSSSIRLWNTDAAFPGFHILNRGFGGSQVADSVQFIDQLVLKHEPKTVVFYAGDNDIAGGKSPEQVAADFRQFAEKLHAKLSQTKLLFIVIKPSVSRWKLAGQQMAANKLIEEYARQTDFVTLIDVWKPMLDSDGQPRPSLFLKDRLHMNEDGYRIWNAMVLPYLLGDSDRVEVSEREVAGNGEHAYQVKSTLQAQETQVRVLLPDDLPSNARPRVVYVLPVEAANERRYGDGLEECRRLNIANRFGVICVAPTFSHLPWYADHPTDRSIRQESYFLKVVVPLIEARYPTSGKAQDRLLLGFSKSGWGAFSLLLRHPKALGKAVAWDAPLMMNAPGNYGSGPIFGGNENYQLYQLSKLVPQQAAHFKDSPRLIHLGYGNFQSQHVEFEALLNAHNISHVYQNGPSRKHDWNSGWVDDAARLLFSEVRGP